MSASNASFLSMDLSLVREHQYYDKSTNISEVFTYANITVPIQTTFQNTATATAPATDVTTDVTSELTGWSHVRKRNWKRWLKLIASR
jgi:hypothetical protein